MVANQGKITTLNDGISGTTGITDGTDKMHSGILKALFAIASGSRVIECGDFTEDTTGSFTTYTLEADIIYTSLGSENTIRANQTVTMTAANASNTRHDLIYIDTDSTMKIKTGNDSATSIVPELDTGEVPVALIEVVGGSADDASHKVQLYLTEINFRDATLIRVKAASGANISKGEALYISGTHNANVAEVDLAMADSSSTMPCIGVAYSDLAPGEEGFAVVLGKANGIAADPSSFNAGDTLYVSPTVAGGLTNTKPTSASHLIQNVGILFNPHASNASVKITGVGRTNDVPNRTFVTQGSDDLENSYQLQGGTGISLAAGGSGSSKTLTVTNDSPDQTVTLTDGTGITTSGTYPDFIITNSAPDQTVSLTGAGITTVTGTYPNFIITSTEDDTLADVTSRGTTTSADLDLNGIVNLNSIANFGSTITLTKNAAPNNAATLNPLSNATMFYLDDATGTATLPDPNAHVDTVITIKNVNATTMSITPSVGTIDNGLVNHDKRVTVANTIKLLQGESITLQAIADGGIVGQSQGWYVADTDTFEEDTDTGITDIVEDISPQLGGHLDVNNFTITSASNGNVEIEPNGTGDIILDGDVSVDTAHSFVAAKLPTATKTTSTLALSDAGKYLFVSASGQTITLPTPTSAGEQYTILANGNDVTLSSGNNMNGSSDDITISSYNGVTCISDGTDWIVLGA